MSQTTTMTMTPKELPEFESREEEMEFWDGVDPWDYVEGPVDMVVNLTERRKPAILDE